jgi:hypothetical protein
MMHAYRYFPAGLAALAAVLPGTAYAACDPSFVEGTNLVNLRPSSSFDSQELVEPFVVRVRNSGDEVCTIRLGVGRTLSAISIRFPDYTLTGSNGRETVSGTTVTADVAGFGKEYIVPANGEISIPYEVRMTLGWGAEAGLYADELVFYLLDEQSGNTIANKKVQLDLDIPRTARIRFAGASGANGPARIEMGPISTTAPTRSPPFALRVLSTSPYKIDLISQNNGALRRAGTRDFIPYQMTLGGQPMNLSGVGHSVRVGRHTSSVGDVHPVMIVINPSPEYHAGDYSDHVTVTVTTI